MKPQAPTKTSSNPPLWQVLLVCALQVQQLRHFYAAGKHNATNGASPNALATHSAKLPDTQHPLVRRLHAHVMRHLGHANELSNRLLTKPPSSTLHALLDVTLCLLEPIATQHNAQTVSTTAGLSFDSHTVVNQAVQAAKNHPRSRHYHGLLNACLRRYLREIAQSPSWAQAATTQGLWNHPAWWIETIQHDWPNEWQAVLRTNNAGAALCLRINLLKTSVAIYQSLLESQGIASLLIGHCGLLITQSVAVSQLPGYAQGWFSVQDASAQRATELLARALLNSKSSSITPASDDLRRVALESHPPKAPIRVLDACAAPGGKTTHLYEWLSPHFDLDLTALEIDADRVPKIHKNLERLGQTARILIADAAQPATWLDKSGGQLFDAILLDAPCTASGIVRRHPDIRWQRRSEDVEQLSNTQSHLLTQLWPLLKSGGMLMYCTCSVFKAEGQYQVQSFLNTHSDAALNSDILHVLPTHMTNASPKEHAMMCKNANMHHLESLQFDGFFYALLVKNKG